MSNAKADNAVSAPVLPNHEDATLAKVFATQLNTGNPVIFDIKPTYAQLIQYLGMVGGNISLGIPGKPKFRRCSITGDLSNTNLKVGQVVEGRLVRTISPDAKTGGFFMKDKVNVFTLDGKPLYRHVSFEEDKTIQDTSVSYNGFASLASVTGQTTMAIAANDIE